MRITFLQEARWEFLGAITYYEGERPGLGQRFKDEVDRTVFCGLLRIPNLRE